MRRTKVIALTAVLALGSTVACSSNGSPTGNATGAAPIPNGSIKIGISLTLSGPRAGSGALAKKAIEIALDNFNKTYPDGVDGHPVEFDFEDDQNNVTQAVNVANKFVAEKVAFVFKPNSDLSQAAQQLRIWNKAGIPVLTFSLGQNEYTDASAWPYLFSLFPSNQQLGDTAAKWLAQQKYTRLAVVTSDSDPDKEWEDDLVKPLAALDPSSTVVQRVTIAPGAVDASTQVAQIKHANPDIVLIALHSGYGPVWNAFNSAGYSPRILTQLNAFFDGYDALGALAAKAFTVSPNCVQKDHAAFPQRVQALLDAYTQGLNAVVPNMLTFLNSSLELEIVKASVEQAHSLDNHAIKTAIESWQNHGFIDNYFVYSYSPTNHYGLTGDMSAKVCSMAPLVDGRARIPVVADAS